MSEQTFSKRVPSERCSRQSKAFKEVGPSGSSMEGGPSKEEWDTFVDDIIALGQTEG